MSNDLLLAIAGLIPLLLSLSVHEYAHGFSASRLGDDTAQRMGRLTLNPIAHIDLFGTILLPLILAFSHSPFMFGWAKPVPVNPARFRRGVRMSTGMAITAGAGPGSNLVLAVLSTVVFALLARFWPGLFLTYPSVRMLLVEMIGINVLLALFNLIPVPPLDGSRVVDALVPARWRQQWEAFSRLAPFLLIGVMLFGGRLIAGPSRVVMNLLQRLVDVIVGGT